MSKQIPVHRFTKASGFTVCDRCGGLKSETGYGCPNNSPLAELERYIRVEYDGHIGNALESLGGIKRVRALFGWADYAVLDSRIYHVPQ